MTIKNIEFKNCILDEIHIREKTTNIDNTAVKESWQLDSILLARFLNNLEAGNIINEGRIITKFIIKRRNLGELDNITLHEIPYESGIKQTLEFIDYTQSAGDLIYSIVPIDESGLDGKTNEIQHESIFTGVWLVDKNDNFTFGFDKQWGGEMRNLDIALQQGRIEIPSLSKYYGVYYTPEEFVRFSLSAVIMPSNFSIAEWNSLVNKITQHIPLIVKSGSGDIYVCDVYSPQKSTWLVNAYRKNDPVEISVECMEIMSVQEYMGE